MPIPDIRPRAAILIFLAAALGLAACSAQIASPDRPAPYFLGETNDNPGLSMQLRLTRVSYPILRSTRQYCGEDTRLSFGLSVAKARPFANENEAIYQGRRGTAPRILYTVPESPAHEAGLRAGDEILSVNGVPTERKGTKLLFRTMSERGDAPLWLLFQRGAKKGLAKIVPIAICDTRVRLAGTPDVVSWATRSTIKVSEGMMRFTRSDTELAFVVAHELSHIVLEHTGAFFGRAGARFENDADYLGLYLLARAGYHAELALDLFPRMAAAFPGIDGAVAYPTIERRCEVLGQTIREIRTRNVAGLPLTPDEKIWRGRGPAKSGRAIPEEEFADRLHRLGRYVKAPVAPAQFHPSGRKPKVCHPEY